MILRLLLIFPFCYLLSGAVWSQLPGYDHVGIELGLSQGMIFDLCTTRDGFLWVGTKDGLNRFDGSRFKVYSHNPIDPYSLADDMVVSLFEDSRGLLWVGTASQGVDVFDRRKGRFHHLHVDFKQRINNTDFHIQKIVEDSKGNIWVMQRGCGLARLTLPETWVAGLPEQGNLLGTVGVDLIAFPEWVEDAEFLGNLWENAAGEMMAASNRFLYQINREDRTAIRIKIPQWPKANFGVEMQNGIIWIIDSDNALIRIKNNIATRQKLPFNWHEGKFVIRTGKHNKVWLSVMNKGWLLDADKPIDPNKPDWEIDRDISVVAVDRNNNLWAGTTGYGLRKINANKRLIASGADGASIWRVWKSHQGRYLLGKYGLIFGYDPTTRQVAQQTAFPEHIDLWQRGIYFEPSGAHWLYASVKLSQGHGSFLYYYDEKGQLRDTYPIQLDAYDYSLLRPDQQGNLWATGIGCHLARFNLVSHQVDYFDYSALFGSDANTVRALDFAIDGNGIYWIATQRGLVNAVLQGNAPPNFTLFQASPNNATGLNNNAVACIMPDQNAPNRTLWIGTKGGGLNKMDISTGKITHIGIDQGLPDKTVYGLLPGNENPSNGPISIWCSTNKGLSKIRLMPNGNYDFTNYVAENGLQDNEFNTQAYFKAPDGELLFGGINGFNHFYPEQLLPDTTHIPIYIVGIEVNSSALVQPARIVPEYCTNLRLEYDQNDLAFEFAALQFSAQSKIRYRYKMEGFHNDWVETRNIRIAQFNHLSPGYYRFLVQGSNGEGRWFDAQPITIVISPPWWRSNLAYFCYMLLVGAAVAGFFRFQLRRQRLHDQLAFEQRETERVTALEQMKTNFFNNMAHEFRTPLTLIMEPVRRILANSKEKKTIEYAQLVEQSGQQLLVLVNQLLDLAKLEAGQAQIYLRFADGVALVQEVFRTFVPLAEQQGISLTIDLPEQPVLFAFDDKKATLVLNNLLSNAIKYNRPSGRVHLSCTTTADAFAIQCADTGMGMDEEALAQIFDRYFRTHDNALTAGTGIGLSLSKDLAEHMGGALRVESALGKGSVFTFSIPFNPPIVVANTNELPDDGTTMTAAPMAAPFPADEEPPLVLVVEDNDQMRQFIANALAGNWRVAQASNGAIGIQMAQDLVPDLIVSDVMMPDRDGLDLCETLKEIEVTAHIPIVLLTAKSSVEHRIKGLRYGADDYLSKPFHTEELLVRIGNLLNSRKLMRQRYAEGSGQAPANTEQPPPLSPLDVVFLEKINQLIEARLDDEMLNVEAVAAHIFVSRVQLHRKLKAITGQHFTDYLRNYRLDRALLMLRNREGKVYEVAFKTGFANEKYFSRAFKEKFGMPPSQA